MCNNLVFKFIFILSFVFTNSLGKAQYISVDTNYNAQQLVDKFLGANNTCISISNINVTGHNFGGNDLSYGVFNKATSNFAIDEGIILSTGKAKSAIGPNNSLQSNTDAGWSGDPDLEHALSIGNTSYNATVLEFDFVSSNSSKIFFEYMFLSEQYLRTIDSGSCNYTDGFAFLIKKVGDTDYKNLAVIPGTNIPIKSNTVRGGGESCPAINDQYFGQYNYGNSPNNFNGETKILTATTDVIPGATYRIKLVIADQGNGLYDSAVFLKAGSFVGNKDLGPDLSLENGTALCTNASHTIDATPTAAQGTAVAYTWKKDGVIIASAQNQPTYIVNYNQPGYYEVEVELASGCKLMGNITIEQQILPTIGNTTFNNICDDDLDGMAEVYFAAYSQQIITNMSESYNVKYFKNPPSNINNPDFSQAINSIKFNTAAQDVYIWIKPGSCTPTLQKITFNQNSKSNYQTLSPIEICDNDLDAKTKIDLTDYLNILIPGYTGQPTYYKNFADAGKRQNAIASVVEVDITQPNQTYYVRFHQSGLCDNVAPISFNLKQPKASTQLPKEVTVCKNATYPELDAGTGKDPITGLGAFTSYEWSFNNATTQSIQNVPAGQYTVKLGYNGCYYTQTVEVKEAPTAIIDAIDISGSTVTVTAIGGTAPYQYALDSDDPAAFQSSHVFKNVTLGNHTIYVKSNDNCDAVSRDFSLINIPNVISPNADGINDVINLSELLNKTDSRLKIYDRLGKLVFEGNTGNSFIWDGKLNGRVLSTGSYWYVAEWIEPTSGKTQQIKSWILLKNY